MTQHEKCQLAVLLRGMSIRAAGGRPMTVIPGGDDCPKGCFVIDVADAFDGAVFDAEIAAKILNEAFAQHEFEQAPSGNEKIIGKEIPLKMETCVKFIGKDNDGVVFWIDKTLDAARARAAKSDNNQLIFEKEPMEAGCAAGASAAQRSDVVKNRVAVVTGGAQGFGEQIVRGLCSSGALVYVADLNFEGAQKLAQTLNETHKRTAAIAVKVNVCEKDSVQAMFDEIAKTTGGLDLCVSNAGVVKAGSVLEQDVSQFTLVTNINYIGFFLMAQCAGRLFRLQNATAHTWKTDLIQINSKSGLEGSNKNGAYAGSKFGGLGLVESFALELVAYNIKVNAICPGNFLGGPLWSDPEKGLFVQYLKAGKVPGATSVADVRAYYEGKVPMRRGCEGADVMRAIYYLVDQQYETGQALPVTGGQVMLH